MCGCHIDNLTVVKKLLSVAKKKTSLGNNVKIKIPIRNFLMSRCVSIITFINNKPKMKNSIK